MSERKDTEILDIICRKLNIPEQKQEWYKQLLKEEEDYAQILQYECDWYNSRKGNLTNYDCPLCKNRGDFWVRTLTDMGNYIESKKCKCMVIRKMYDTMETSGLGDMLKIYTLEKYNHNLKWQDDVYNTAIGFINQPTNAFYIGGQIGCVDKDTEFFNGKEWKKICDYTKNDLVLQYNENGTTQLVKPINYIKEKCDTLNYVKTQYGLDMCVCDNHNVVYVTSKGHLAKIKFSELKERHELNKYGFSGKFITTFNYSGKGINLTDDEIKLFCAVICDGSYYYHIKNKNCTSYKKARFHIKKERKKQELRDLFIKGNFEWYEKESASKGYTDFYVMTPYRLKTFTKDWYNCNNHQLKIICDNILKWDGSETNGRKRFFSRDKKVIDFIQFAFASQGIRSTISVDNRIGRNKIVKDKNYVDKKITYNLCISKNSTLISMENKDNKVKIQDYKTLDGYKYCFTVPSHIWVMRRNGRILITGNCGKTHICTAIVGSLIKKKIYDIKYVVWEELAILLKQETYEDKNSYNERLDDLRNCEVLYIDDLFKTTPSEADIKNCFNIINYRYNLSNSHKEENFITIISSEKTIAELLKIDEAIASRIIELANGYTIDIGKDVNKNYRIKKAQSKNTRE